MVEGTKQAYEKYKNNPKTKKVKKTRNEATKDRIMGNVKTIFEQEEDYQKPVTVSNFWNNNYVEFGSNGDRNKNLSIKEYLHKIKLHLEDIINDLKKFDT